MFARFLGQVPLRAMGFAGLACGSTIAVASQVSGVSHAAAPAAGPLDPNEWRPFKLLSREVLTKDTPNPVVHCTFDTGGQSLHLPVASCLLARAPIGSQKEDGSKAFVIRPYTPVNHPEDTTLDLVVKAYPSGKMSKHLAEMRVGDVLEVKGPIPKLPLSEIAKRKDVGLVAGGTGLTPMLQVVEEVLRQKLPLNLTLVFANMSEADIMLKPRLDALAEQHRGAFRVHYVVDKASSPAWTGGVGYLTEGMLRAWLPPPTDSSLILVCGPPGMMAAVSGDKAQDKSQGPLSGLLAKMGYTSTQVFKF